MFFGMGVIASLLRNLLYLGRICLDNPVLNLPCLSLTFG